MNGISKESYLKATPELKDEMMFDMIYGLHKKLENHVLVCPVRRSVNRLWAYALGFPAVVFLIIGLFKILGA